MPLNFPIGSAALPVSLNVDATTDSDVVTALLNDTAFPDREIQLGRVAANFTLPTVTFSPGANASVSVKAAASFQSGIAIFQTPAPVLKALPLDPAVPLNFQQGNNDRFLLMSFGYTATGSLNGTVPIGMLGSASFGISGQTDAALAVIHRFDRNHGAADVLQAAIDSFKLPSQVNTAAGLSAGSWLVAEVDGNVALSLAASLGYKLSYSKELQLLGVSHDLGVKIDAAITATLGFTASGKFLVVLSRPAADQRLHLQLMKQNKNGVSLGLALSAGIQADPKLPDKIDDFLSSLFGTHGQQILKDLHSIESWVSGDLGSNLAALTTKTAKDLLAKVTGLDPDAALAQATGMLKDALADWEKLAQNGSAEVQALAWKLLPNDNARNAIIALLTGLSNSGTFDQTLSDALQNLENRQWLAAIADAVGSASGLALGQRADQVKSYAAIVLSVLNGEIFKKLQKTIDDQFDLSKIVAATDPAKLTEWVQGRLAAFLDKTVLSRTDLLQIQQALKTLGGKINDLYSKLKSAINTRYSIDFALKYERNTADTALIDVEFDLAQAPAARLYQSVMGIGNAAQPSGAAALFALGAPVAGVKINEALLTHEIHSSATTHFAIPFFTSDTAHLNDTVATLAVEQNGEHLVASVKSKDQVKTGRFTSILNLAGSLTVEDNVTPQPGGNIAYELRFIQKSMRQAELVNGTKDFVNTYLTDKFPSPAAYADQFLKDLDITISHVMPNPTNNFGDMAVSLQVALTTDLFSAWIVQRDAADLLAAQCAVSRRIQTLLRKFTALSYLQDLSKLNSFNTVAPLLVWCALPVAAGVDFDVTSQTINALNTGKDVYWDFADINLVRKMVNLVTTEKNLEAILPDLFQRLLAAGDKHNASFYGPDFESAAGALRSTVLNAGPQGQTMPQFQSLLIAEAGVIGTRRQLLFPPSGIAKVLDVGSQLASSGDASARVNIARELASFGEALTSTLNSGLSNIYTKQNLMTYGPMLLVELSQVLTPDPFAATRSAMMQLLSLKLPRKFDLSTFLTGSYPDGNEIAVGQTLVSLG